MNIIFLGLESARVCVCVRVTKPRKGYPRQIIFELWFNPKLNSLIKIKLAYAVVLRVVYSYIHLVAQLNSFQTRARACRSKKKKMKMKFFTDHGFVGVLLKLYKPDPGDVLEFKVAVLALEIIAAVEEGEYGRRRRPLRVLPVNLLARDILRLEQSLKNKTNESSVYICVGST